MNNDHKDSRSDKVYINKLLLNYLIRELENISSFEFEEFITMLLTKKYGPTKWPPQDGSDGKIDFASSKDLFQIYGSESKRGSFKYIEKKLSEIKDMKETAKENGLQASNIIFLTNIHPDKKMAKLILNSNNQGNQIKDVYQTAEFLYNEFYPFGQLVSYHNSKCDSLAKENWPYDIDENTFVENFEFKVGSNFERKIPDDKESCITCFCNKLLIGSVICVGFYGMGKTTISKMLFKKWDYLNSSVYPVYITLTHRLLSDFHGEKLVKQIAEEVKLYFLKNNLNDDGSKSAEVFDDEIFEKNIARMIEAKKILIIFDGIDESIFERNELLYFLDLIFKKNISVFITCRLEFRPFFDVYQALRIENNPFWIELSEWKSPQWEKYIAGLAINNPLKKDLISAFKVRLDKGIYSTLPNRPLFLKMLSDLEINNETGVSILPSLSHNLAETYFKFIKWKIKDDYNRKGGAYNFDLEEFERECFELLIGIALLEYLSVINEKESQVILNSIQRICSEKNFTQLSEEYVSNILLSSSLFAILRRVDGTRFTFSHKSFMEYLVAFSLVDCLFPEDGNSNKAICNEVWRCFQTHEISQHLVNEIERIQITLKLTVEKRNEFILNAFKRIVDKGIREDLMNYDERFQEVIYYIGKLKISSSELINILKHIIENKNQYHSIYFRSASLALSRIIGAEHCEKYVLYLLDNRRNDGNDFKLNQDIQIRYYGKATLRQILKNDIDAYIFKQNTSSIISLKILTFFTAIPPELDDIDFLNKYLHQVYDTALKHGHANIKIICEECLKILPSGDISHSEALQLG